MTAQEDLANQTLSSAEISVRLLLMTMMMSVSIIVLCLYTHHVVENVKKMDAKINVDITTEAGMEPGNHLVRIASHSMSLVNAGTVLRLIAACH